MRTSRKTWFLGLLAVVLSMGVLQQRPLQSLAQETFGTNPYFSRLTTENDSTNELESETVFPEDPLRSSNFARHPGLMWLAGANCSSTTAVTYGDVPVSSTLSTAGEIDCFTFTGQSGEKIRVQVVSTSGSITLSGDIFLPDNLTILCGSAIVNALTCDLTVNGTYTIDIKAFNGTAMGNYNLSIQRLNNPVGCSSIAYGNTPTNATIDVPAEIDCYLLDGIAGEKVRLRGVKFTPTLSLSFEVLRPDGAVACSVEFGPELDCDFTTTGQHTVIVKLFATTTVVGDYGLSIQRLNNPVGCTSSAYGDSLGQIIDHAAEFDCFTFNGQPGEKSRLRAVKLTAELSLSLEILRPDGSVLCSINFGPDLLCDLDTTGQHTAIVKLFATTTAIGNYGISLQRLNNPVGCLSLTYGSALLEGTIGGAGEEDCYTFNGNAGETPVIWIANTSGASIINAQVYDASGTLICFHNTFLNKRFSCTLADSETYSIFVVDGFLKYTGTYSLQIDTGWYIGQHTAAPIAFADEGPIEIKTSSDFTHILEIRGDPTCLPHEQHSFSYKPEQSLPIGENGFFALNIPLDIPASAGHTHSMDIDGVFFDTNADGKLDQAVGGFTFRSNTDTCVMQWAASILAPDTDSDGWSDVAEQALGSSMNNAAHLPENTLVPTTHLASIPVCEDFKDNDGDNFIDALNPECISLLGIELRLRVIAPERASPGQRVKYIIEYQNIGSLDASNVLVFVDLDPSIIFYTASFGYYHSEPTNEVSWEIESVPFKSGGSLEMEVEIPWGLPFGTQLLTQVSIIEDVNINSSSRSAFTYEFNGETKYIQENLLETEVEVSSGLSFGTQLSTPNLNGDSNFASISSGDGLFVNGIGLKSSNTNSIKNYERFLQLISSRPGTQITNNILWGKAYVDTEDLSIFKNPPLEGQPLRGAVHTLVASLSDVQNPSQFIDTSSNGLRDSSIVGTQSPQYYNEVWAYSGGTRTVVSAILSGKLVTDHLYLISPALVDIEDYSAMIRQGIKVTIFQSPLDDIFDDKIGELTYDASKSDVDRRGSIFGQEAANKFMEYMVKEFERITCESGICEKVTYLKFDAMADGNTIEIETDKRPRQTLKVQHKFNNEIISQLLKELGVGKDYFTLMEYPNVTHGYWIKFLNNMIKKKGGIICPPQTIFAPRIQILGKVQAAQCSIRIPLLTAIDIETARDPNAKHVDREFAQPGELMNFTIEFENEGEGIAYGVYITDTLEEDIDTTSLILQSGEVAVYDPATRTITWYIGEVGPGGKGERHFSARVRPEAVCGDEVTNYATVYFPSVPETTPTNGVAVRVVHPSCDGDQDGLYDFEDSCPAVFNLADVDSDGKDGEDPQDGLDNDNDGLTDEDYEAGQEDADNDGEGDACDADDDDDGMIDAFEYSYVCLNPFANDTTADPDADSINNINEFVAFTDPCPVNAPPPSNTPSVVVNDSYSVLMNTALSINAPGVLTNDTDVDNDQITAVLVASPSHGTVQLNANGSFTYTPTAGFTGNDSFTYHAYDGKTNSLQSAIVMIVVNSPTNVAPVAIGNTYTTAFNTVLNIAAPGVLGNDTDINQDALSAVKASDPTHGTVVLNANGSLTYTPVTGYSGNDSFTYYVSDGKVNSTSTAVTITILPQGSPNSGTTTTQETNNTTNSTTISSTTTNINTDGTSNVILLATVRARLLNLRISPSVNGRILAQLRGGSGLEVLGRTSNNRWVFIRVNGAMGWVSARFVILSGELAALPILNGESSVPLYAPTTITVRANRLNFRSEPSLQGQILRVLRNGETYSIIGRSRNGLWAKISVSGQIGWVYIYWVNFNGNLYAIPIVN